MHRVLLAAGLALCSGLPAGAQAAPESNDVLIVADGRILMGHSLEREEGGVVVHFKNGDVHVPAALIVEVLIEGEDFEPTTEEERAEAAKGRVRFEGKWMSVSQRDSLVEKRVAEQRDLIQDQIDHSTWGKRKQQESRYFAWEHVLPAHVYERYSALMDAYFDQFAKDWKIKAPKQKLPVCFYKDQAEMVQIGGAGPGVLGYFRFVEPLDLNFFYERLDTAFTEEVMFHETNHYLQSLIEAGFQYPHFPGESLAEYYGASRFDQKKNRIESGLVLEGRLVEVQSEVLNGEMMPLERLVTTPRMYEHYTWGWTLIHFLMSQPSSAKAFKEFFVGLAEDSKVSRVSMGVGTGALRTCEATEVWRYFKACLDLDKPEKLRDFEGGWHDYVKERLDFVSPHGKSRAAEQATQEGRRLRAKRLHTEALEEGGRSDPLILHRAAQFHLQDGRPAEAIALWREALVLAPLEAEFYAWLGSALKQSKDTKEEGLRMQLLALDIDPYNEHAALDVDLTELLGGEDEGEGGGEGGKPRPPKGN
jgi:tetratricopeptide (TPR) repeat protein